MATGALIASAALAGLSAVNQYQTARKQDSAAAAAIRQNMHLQQQANAKVSQAIQQQGQSNPQQTIADLDQQYLQQLQQNQQLAQQRLQRTGLGQAYSQRAASDQASQDSYISQLANLMAQSYAPTLQRQQEQFNFGDLGTQLGLIGNQANGNANVAKLQAATTTPNPYLQGLGAAGMRYLNGLGRGG